MENGDSTRHERGDNAAKNTVLLGTQNPTGRNQTINRATPSRAIMQFRALSPNVRSGTEIGVRIVSLARGSLWGGSKFDKLSDLNGDVPLGFLIHVNGRFR